MGKSRVKFQKSSLIKDVKNVIIEYIKKQGRVNILEVSYLSDLDMDAYLFHDGTYFKSYDMLGAHEKSGKGCHGNEFCSVGTECP